MLFAGQPLVPATTEPLHHHVLHYSRFTLSCFCGDSLVVVLVVV